MWVSGRGCQMQFFILCWLVSFTTFRFVFAVQRSGTANGLWPSMRRTLHIVVLNHSFNITDSGIPTTVKLISISVNYPEKFIN